MPKFGGTTMEGPPQMRMPKLKLFNCLSYTHEIFRIDKCEEKIKFDKTLRCLNERSSSYGTAKMNSFYPLKLNACNFQNR